MLQDAIRGSSATELERSRCRAAVAPALLPLCRWLWSRGFFFFAHGVCECIVKIATAAATGSEMGLHAFSRLSDGAVVNWHPAADTAQMKASGAETRGPATVEAAAARSETGEGEGVLDQLGGKPAVPISRSAGLGAFLRVFEALLQLASDDCEQWVSKRPTTRFDEGSAMAPEASILAVAASEKLMPGMAAFAVSLSNALSAVSSAAQMLGQPVELHDLKSLVHVMLRLLRSLTAQNQARSVSASSALRDVSLAFSCNLLCLIPLLQRRMDGAIAQRKPVPWQEGSLTAGAVTVYDAMGIAATIARVSVTMLQAAAAKCANTNSLLCIEGRSYRRGCREARNTLTL